ncbi:uncharacterized protein CEXT_393591 [Caerostris extrusa]|uniref:Uncharacterized protein n=1 Tax=Caerostris extrusa TaxID=172846 RepID=A0AAV4NYX7_CAEEX|nr:uncharacterized protein CEXT_393591 [Caerostris extrusa]
MGFSEKLHQWYLEAKSFDFFLCLSAIIFAFLGNEKTAFSKQQNCFSVSIQSLFEAFLRAFLAEAMSFLTWKVIVYTEEVSTHRRGLVLISLFIIHALWIYLTNLCFTCMLTKVETVITLLEFLALITISTSIIRCVIMVLKNAGHIFMTKHSSQFLHVRFVPKFSNSEAYVLSMRTFRCYYCRTTTPILFQYDDMDPIKEQEFLQSKSRRRRERNKVTMPEIAEIAPSNFGTEFPDVSPESGIPYCRHRTNMKSSVTVLKSKDLKNTPVPVKPNVRDKIPLAESPYPLIKSRKNLKPAWDFLESKTRSGVIYNKVKVDKSTCNKKRTKNTITSPKASSKS